MTDARATTFFNPATLGAPMDAPHRIPHPWPGQDVDAWLLPGTPITLVDCGPGTEEGWRALRAGLGEAGFEPEDVDRLVLTHAHVDHFGTARRLRQAGAEVLAAPEAAEVVASWAPEGESRWEAARPVLEAAGCDADLQDEVREGYRLYGGMGAPVDVDGTVAGGDLVEGDGWALQVLEVPGHAPGHLALHDPDGARVLPGDALLERIATNAGHLAPRTGDLLGDYLASLDALEALGPATVHPGHGPTFEDAAATAGKHREHVTGRLGKVRKILEGATAGLCAWDVVDHLYVGRPNPYLALSEVLGYLEHLMHLGEADATEDGGVRWFLVP